MNFQTPATIESISTRADKTLKIVVGTQELSNEEYSVLFGLHDKLGWFMFSENVFNENDIPKEQAPDFRDEKSPSQRLRNILFIFWKENTKQDKTFDVWKNEWYEKKIAEIRNYLPERE